MAIVAPVNRGTGTNTTNNATIPVNTAGASTAGNLLVFFVANNTNAPLTSVSGGGATWTVDVAGGSSVTSLSIASAVVPVGGIADATTITGTVSASMIRKVGVLLEVGVDGSWSWPATPTDRTITNTATSPTSFDTGTTAATTQADEIVFAAVSYAGNVTAFTHGTGFTEANFGSPTGVLVVSPSNTPRSIIVEYKVVSATGAQSDAATNSVSMTQTGDYVAGIATYKPTVVALGTTYEKAGAAAWGPVT